MKRMTLAYSPCPNDTFAFHAMINGLVDTEGIAFDVHLMDIEELNHSAAQGKYDLCKMSYHAYFHFLDRYLMLRCGSALGYGNGPVFVRKAGNADVPPYRLVAVPGKMTTAALLLHIAHPEIKAFKEIIFSGIAREISEGKVDAGVLIHEGRFVFQDRGLELIEDLGETWFQRSQAPIPLGGIAIRRDRSEAAQIERILRRSIAFAMEHPEMSAGYIAANAQELSPEIQRRHIELFVNNNTLELSEEGEKAVEKLYDGFLQLNPSLKRQYNLFTV